MRRHDPERGCGLMLLAVGVPIAAAFWALAIMGFGRVTGWY